MSEVLKISYRSFGGFLLFSFIFTFAASSFAFLLAGIAVIALSFLVLLNPSILDIVPIMLNTTRVVDPIPAFAILIVIGMLCLFLGLGFYILTIKLWNYSMRLDKGIARYVDTNVPRTGELLDRVKKPAVHQVPQDKISKLERLTKLREQGTLTETEFEQEKQLILKGKD